MLTYLLTYLLFIGIFLLIPIICILIFLIMNKINPNPKSDHEFAFFVATYVVLVLLSLGLLAVGVEYLAS